MFQNVTIDRNGNYWFGTEDKGLFCLSGYKMANPDEPAQTAQTDSPDPTQPSHDNPSTGQQQSDHHNTAATESEAQEDRIKLTPNLEEGYLTISMNSPEAQVTFLNAKGEKVRTVPKYRNGSHINISKMKKGTYTVKVKTPNGTRTAKFTLK